MKHAVVAITVASLLAAGVSAQAQISYQPAPVTKTQVFTLEARDGISCSNGTLNWPVTFIFPAGLMAQIPVIKNSDPITFNSSDQASRKGYSLAFDVLSNGRMTNIRPAGGDLALNRNAFLPAWAAGWNLGPQAKPLTGCKMTWDVKTDFSPEMARALTYEARHLRNYASGLKLSDSRSEDCRAADRRIRLKAYPEASRLSRKPGRPQWLVAEYDILANGKVKTGHRLRGSGETADLDAIEKALGQRVFYPGQAVAQCLTSFAIPAADLPVEQGVGELMTLNNTTFGSDGDGDEQKTCPAEARSRAMSFIYRPEYYPAQAARLGVEGVAMLSFDVAPWGQVRLKSSWSHPLPEFGQAASSMLTQSTFKVSERGLSGCRLLVRFVRGKDGSDENEVPGGLEDSAS
ncbi:energy transducer TonB [Asticcacaulis excentricus]|uniref:TonB domain protein n=1 Tax=Asticcacaulis excentricus (strain ATCC 15261 / DSM 4724 / KCTC 12464 / NCIMB 9791 / VKM B-1370 / CB 48) TaxID=573065 RepID=E8RVL4_ASTEC|nr:energy transducer TonB [Asticcacaulis excentricus]ADU15183.1 TonB domain protein [Asticcacaulis excentricus CB 48]